MCKDEEKEGGLLTGVTQDSDKKKSKVPNMPRVCAECRARVYLRKGVHPCLLRVTLVLVLRFPFSFLFFPCVIAFFN